MEKVVTITTHSQDRTSRSALEYWLSRPAAERIAEVERLRREYVVRIRGIADGSTPGLSRTRAVIQRTGSVVPDCRRLRCGVSRGPAIHGGYGYLLLAPDERNVSKALLALEEFGFPMQGLNALDVVEKQCILQLGRQPYQIHMMTSVTGLSWERAWTERVAGFYGACPVHFIGKTALVANKLAAGRRKDLADVEALEGAEE